MSLKTLIALMLVLLLTIPLVPSVLAQPPEMETVVKEELTYEPEPEKVYYVQPPVLEESTQNSFMDPGQSKGLGPEFESTRASRMDAFTRDGSKTGSRISDSETVYAIICPPGWASLVEPLRDWKTKKGVPANIYYTTTIISAYPGYDVQEQIHNFLIELDSSAPLTWVLFIGDTEQIPTRKLYCRAQDFSLSKFYDGDYYYTGLDNDWDSDNDNIYGEIRSTEIEGDFSPNVYVGRLPVGNVTECNESISNILMYEQTLPGGAWNSKAEFWGTLMDAPNDGTVYQFWEDNAKKVLDKVEKIYPSYMTVAKRYDYDSDRMDGGTYTLGQDQLDGFVAKTKFDEGCGIVNFAGQAYYDGNTLAEYHSNTGLEGAEDSICWWHLFTHDDAYGANNGDKLPFFYAAACDAANISETDDTNQQKLLYAPNGGAIGFVSSVGESYRGEMQDKSEGNWWLEERFWSNFFNTSYNNIYTRQGACLGRTMWQYNAELLYIANIREAILANMYGYILLGCPEVDIYTKAPAEIFVSHDQIYTGTRNTTFTVTGGAGAPQLYSLVCVQNDHEYQYGWTNANGKVKLQLTLDNLDNLTITVSSHNFYPKTVNATVLTAPADLQTWDALLKRDVTDPVQGDTITLNATVVNGGELVASGCTGAFYEGDPNDGGVMIGSEFNLGSIAGGLAKYIETTWTPTGGWKQVHVVFNMTGDLDYTNNNASFTVYVEPPEYEVTQSGIGFSQGWGVPGENVTITARITNKGDGAASMVVVEAFSGNRTMGGWLITTTTVSPAAGTYTDWNFDLAVNSSEHAVFIYVNWDQSIFEKNYGNNKAFKILYGNAGPKIGNLTDLTIAEDALGDDLVDLGATVTDIDNSTNDLTMWVVATGPNTVTLDPAGKLDISLLANWNGEFGVIFWVTDHITTVSKGFNVTVTPVNDAPVINFTSAATALEKLPVSYWVQASDVEGDALNFSDDTDVFDIDPVTGYINFTPQDDDVGVHTIVITVTDSGGASATTTFTLTVTGDNDPPQVTTPPNAEVAVGQSWSHQLVVTDPDSTTFTYTDNTELFDIDTDGRMAFTASNNQAGTHEITVWVNDGEDTTAVKFWINVTGGTDGGSSSDGEDKNFLEENGLILLIVAALVILLVVIVIVVVFVMKGKQEDKPEPEEEDEEDEEPEDDYDDEYDDDYDDDYDDEYDDEGYDDFEDQFDSEDTGSEDYYHEAEEEVFMHEPEGEVVMHDTAEEPKIWKPEEEEEEEEPPRRRRKGKGRKGRKGKGRKRRPKQDDDDVWM